MFGTHLYQFEQELVNFEQQLAKNELGFFRSNLGKWSAFRNWASRTFIGYYGSEIMKEWWRKVIGWKPIGPYRELHGKLYIYDSVH